MKTVSKIALSLLVFTVSAHAVCDDIYISEYIEGSSYNKAIELYNPTDASVVLSDYQLELYSNGRALADGPTSSTVLSSEIASHGVYVLANSQAAQTILDVTNEVSSTINHNGDDAYILRKISTDEIVDSIGQVGVDPGSAWADTNASTKDNTLVKKDAQCADNDISDEYLPSVMFDAYAQDSFEFLGSHLSSSEPTPEIEPELVLISTIQGEGDASPLQDSIVSVEALVTGVYPNLNGFFIQEEATDMDENNNTSEGLFVYCSTCENVSVGDLVKVTGKVKEYYDFTELSNVESFEIVSSGNTLPAYTNITMPFTNSLEAYEGMLVEVTAADGELVLLQNYYLGQYGELTFGAERLEQFTQSNVPSQTGYTAHLEMLENNIITLDDGSTSRNPDPLFHDLTPTNPFRAGSTTTSLKGCLSYSYSVYRVQPQEQLSLSDTNAREAAPQELGGNLKVASFNVLNYFNTFSGCTGGVTGSAMDCRGADDALEFERQRSKIIAALSTIDADIVGIMEIENDGYADDSALADLVSGLNTYIGEETYSFLDVDTKTATVDAAGNDAIRVALIYKSSKVTPTEKTIAAYLDDVEKNRVSVIQEFQDIQTEEKLVVSVNHLKSKGSACDSITYAEGADIDNSDGQANCNLTRLYAAKELLSVLETSFDAQSNIIILGDLNAYANEDPIQEILSHGYSNVHQDFAENTGYSYIFDSQIGTLDYALANSVLSAKVTGATAWHINTDEAAALDYDMSYTSDNQDELFYAADAYRSSDHDPIIVGIALEKAQPEHLLNVLKKHHNRVLLSWKTLQSKRVDIYRNDKLIKTKRNKGRFLDKLHPRNTATYTYKVCEKDTKVCTNEVEVSFEVSKKKSHHSFFHKHF